MGGNVAVKCRIIPKEPEKFEDMKKEVFSKLRPFSYETEEIGFGVKALLATFIVPDEEGQQEKLESTIASCETVDSHYVLEVSLVG